MGVVLNPMELMYRLPADALKLSNQVYPEDQGGPIIAFTIKQRCFDLLESSSRV